MCEFCTAANPMLKHSQNARYNYYWLSSEIVFLSKGIINLPCMSKRNKLQIKESKNPNRYNGYLRPKLVYNQSPTVPLMGVAMESIACPYRNIEDNYDLGK